METEKNILIVDDDRVVSQTISTILEKKGYAVSRSPTAQKALKMSKTVDYHLAILDIRLPDRDGIEVIPELKNQHPNIVIVVITGHPSTETAIKALNTGATYYFHKPLDFDQLTAVIKESLDKQELVDENQRLSKRLQAELKKQERMEQKLRISERRLRKIIDKNADGVLIVGNNGIVRFVNPAAERILNRRTDELRGETFGFPIAGDHSTELELISPSGVIQTVELRTVELSWEGEEAYLVSLRDITDRKRAEEAFRESEQKYRVLFQSSADALYISTYEGQLIDVNQSFLELFGYTRKELMELNFKHLYQDPEDRYDFIGAMEAKGFVKNYSVKFKKKDSTIIEGLLTASAKLDPEGVVIGFQGIIRDITQHKIDERKIRKYSKELEKMVAKRTHELNRALYDTEEARDKIDGILKSVGDGLMVTDTYNRVILMNRAAEDLLDVRLSEVLDRPVDFAIQDNTLRRKVKDTLKKKKSGYEFDFNLDVPGSKSTCIMRARTSVIEDRRGKQSGIVTIIHDVTKDREVDRMKSDFISTAAHELRTPLTSIQGFSELLLTRKDLKSEERKKFLAYVNRQAENLSRIVGDLLDLSRLEAGKGVDLKKEAYLLEDLIQDQIAYFQSITNQHRIESATPKERIRLFVDKEKIEQCVSNILSNAVKYSPDGGNIRVRGKSEDSVYRLSVSDEGIGMTQQQIDRMFDKFYRVDASDSAPVGTGLGMTIVNHIVEAHGGKVWVTSQSGRGTTIHMTLPLAKEGPRVTEK